MSLNTDQGFNALAVLIPITTAATQMPDGIWKWVLLIILSIAATVVGIQTKGDKPEEIDEHSDIAEILQKGRE